MKVSGEERVEVSSGGELVLSDGRYRTTLTEIMEKEDHHTVLAVSHGAACRQFMRYWEHTSSVTPKGRLGNCCILKFKYDNRKFELLEIVNPNP